MDQVRAQHSGAPKEGGSTLHGLPEVGAPQRYARSQSETPTEIQDSRLTGGFPALRKDIERIAEAFDREVYGGVVLDENQLTMAYSAWFR